MNKKLIFAIVSISFVLLMVANSKPSNKSEEQKRIDALTKLSYTIDLIEKYYVDDMNMTDLVNKAIAGVTKELDAHSGYMDKKAYKNMKTKTKGEFGGLGIVVGMKNGALTVISPIDDTPAKLAGVQSGDIILKIDKKSTIDMTLSEAVSLMRGKPGTNIVLTILRKNEAKPLKIHITRDIIEVKSVFSKRFQDNDMLYIRIASFDAKVQRSLEDKMINVKKYSGVVLDLRDNPGGLLSQAIEVVDDFINSGTIVSQKSRDKSEDKVYRANKYSTLTDKPMVVLINGGSASASEIVAGALQDHKRAIIVGEKSFGKGSVQQIIPITTDNSEAIRLTISRYYLPSGRTIQAVGVTPDIESFSGASIKKDESEFELKEKDLKKHLKSELEKIAKKKKEKRSKDDKIITKEDIQNDNQLNTAVNILKVLILTKK